MPSGNALSWAAIVMGWRAFNPPDESLLGAGGGPEVAFAEQEQMRGWACSQETALTNHQAGVEEAGAHYGQGRSLGRAKKALPLVLPVPGDDLISFQVAQVHCLSCLGKYHEGLLTRATRMTRLLWKLARDQGRVVWR